MSKDTEVPTTSQSVFDGFDEDEEFNETLFHTNGRPRLSSQQLEEISVEIREGTSFTKIAEDFKVSYASIQNINEGNTHKYRIANFEYPIRPSKKRILELSKRRHRERTAPENLDPYRAFGWGGRFSQAFRR